MKAERLPNLQILRGIAALAVVYSHSNWYSDIVQLHPVLPTYAFIKNFGSCGVDLFFVLSGLVVSLSAARAQSVGHFVARRAFRIYPFFWLILTLYLFWRFGSQPVHRGDLGSGAWSYLLMPSFSDADPFWLPFPYMAWTLIFEIFFYTALAIGIALKKFNSLRVCAGIVTAVVVLSWISWVPYPVLTYYGNPMALEFLLGMGIGTLLGREWLARWSLLLMALGAGLLLGSVFFDNTQITNISSLIQDQNLSLHRVVMWGVPSAILVAGCALFPNSPKGRFGAAMILIGDACYSIYLGQWIPLEFFHLAAHRLKFVPDDLLVFLLVALVTSFGVGVYVVLERPLLHRLNRLIQTKPNSKVVPVNA